ncbi:hypothetical protein FQZ97_1075790 [compost metagenome]
MQWRRCDAKAFCAAWHSRIVDRLDIDAVDVEKTVAGFLAQFRIANQNWYDMSFRRHDRETGSRKNILGALRLALLAIALDLRNLQVTDRSGSGSGNCRRK